MAEKPLKKFSPGDRVEILENDTGREVFKLLRNGEPETWTYEEFSNGVEVDIDIVQDDDAAARQRN